MSKTEITITGMTCGHCEMSVTNAIATLEGIPREALDALAAETQRRADVAIREGRFDKSLITVHNLDGTIALDREQFPRPSTTAESLAGLEGLDHLIWPGGVPAPPRSYHRNIPYLVDSLHQLII